MASAGRNDARHRADVATSRRVGMPKFPTLGWLGCWGSSFQTKRLTWPMANLSTFWDYICPLAD